jgi:signal transduction histidine kinase
LLLGEKRDGGLYAQEEIEFARTAGERLIDIQVSAEMGRRLMALQRQRLVESQVLDRRARRSLHDDILPRLHTAMLALSSAKYEKQDELSDTLVLLGEVHHQIADLLREMPATTAPQVTQLGLVGALRQMLTDEFQQAFDQVDWQINPIAVQRSEKIPPLVAEVLFYAVREAVRNAARYGHDESLDTPLHLHVVIDWQGGLEILIEDDGTGIRENERDDGGSGQGLALHSTMLAVVGGALSVESQPSVFTRVRLRLPEQSLESFYISS